MNHIEILEYNLNSKPSDAQAYNFHLGCFTKKTGQIEWIYASYANSWRIHSGNYCKKFSILLDATSIEHAQDVYKIIGASEEVFKNYICNINSL